MKETKRKFYKKICKWKKQILCVGAGIFLGIAAWLAQGMDPVIEAGNVIQRPDIDDGQVDQELYVKGLVDQEKEMVLKLPVSARQYTKGSLTVEASCVMAVVLFSLAALIGKAGQIHDETAAAMVLHEGIEKCRHEKNIRSEDAEAFFKRNAGLMLRYTDLTVSIQEKGAKKMGKVKGGDWEKQIEMKEFRPEEFMRMVTGITGGTNEN